MRKSAETRARERRWKRNIELESGRAVPVSFKILSFVILKFVVDLPPGQVQYLEAFRELEQRQRAAYVEMHISMYSCKNYIYYLFLFLNFV